MPVSELKRLRVKVLTLGAENRRLKDKIRKLKTPEPKMPWTHYLGRPGNWRELAPETQRRWIENQYARALTASDGSDIGDYDTARLEALANVGSPLPGEELP